MSYIKTLIDKLCITNKRGYHFNSNDVKGTLAFFLFIIFLFFIVLFCVVIIVIHFGKTMKAISVCNQMITAYNIVLKALITKSREWKKLWSKYPRRVWSWARISTGSEVFLRVWPLCRSKAQISYYSSGTIADTSRFFFIFFIYVFLESAS